MLFLNEIQENRFNEFIKKDNTAKYDIERQAFFYIMASSDELYGICDQVYNFEENIIRYVDINEIKLHNSFIKMIALAYNMYNNYDNGETVLDIFGYLDEYNFEVAINALKIRTNK